MNLEKYKKIWQQEEIKSFKGWDFSYINNRIQEEKLPWDYKTLVDLYLKKNHYLLDMGTGGGEFLLSLNHPYKFTSVTESYLPNLKLCQNKLGNLGINVKYVENDSKLPFNNETFDIIINRHESYNISEVNRILKKNGYFITQQVGYKNNLEFSRFLLNDKNHNSFFDCCLENDTKNLKKFNFEIIEQKEFFPYLRFLDIGALVYFAKIIEWEFPNFSVENCFHQLKQLQIEIEKKGFIESTEHRYLIIIKKLG